LLVIYILRVLFQFLYDYFSHKAGFNVEHALRHKVYNHIQTLSPKWFSNRSTGQIVSRLNDDARTMELLIAHDIPDLIVGVIMFVGTLIMLFTINPVLAGFVCIPMPLILIASFIARKIRQNYAVVKEQRARMLGDLTDNVQGIKEIQVFNKQERELTKISAQSQTIKNTLLKVTIWRSLINPIVSLMQGFGTIIIICVGGVLAIYHGFDAADITAFLLYIGLLYTPLANLARILDETQDCITSGKRMFDILDTKSKIVDRENAQDVGTLKGEIEFHNVSFKYRQKDEDTPPTLKNISFTAPAGKMIALVGPTGSGKSTIASLITRFYDVTAGSVTIDGIDVRDMTLRSLRENLSIVLQDVFLFNGSLFDNISYGKENATEEEIIAAAKMAAIHDFIVSLPEGYGTIVGERGTRLSGGQKQRIALARAILRNSPILILDEATSAVDNETESQIQKAIGQIQDSSHSNRTMIVIAHRLTTIERADEILFLQDGEIKERGTHAELITKNGFYARMQGKL